MCELCTIVTALAEVVSVAVVMVKSPVVHVGVSVSGGGDEESGCSRYRQGERKRETKETKCSFPVVSGVGGRRRRTRSQASPVFYSIGAGGRKREMGKQVGACLPSFAMSTQAERRKTQRRALCLSSVKCGVGARGKRGEEIRTCMFPIICVVSGWRKK